MSKKLPESVRQYFAAQGRKGGRAGSREDKQRAGRLGHKAMIAKLSKTINEAPKEEPKEDVASSNESAV